jgi:D-glycero-D-manno-heptose 1,7-bisphosphate phosphatase
VLLQEANMRKAIFLDRDGVINVDIGYLHKIEDLVLTHRLVDALKIFKSLGYLIIIVTNQSGIARRYFTVDQLNLFHDELKDVLAKEIDSNIIDRIYFCPHHPDFNEKCDCRKPRPGMLLEAKNYFNIDMKNSYMVGDKESDMLAGQSAGVDNLVGISDSKSLVGSTIMYQNTYQLAKFLNENSN